MPRVVSNSSPIIHLAKIGQMDLLRRQFRTITVPEAVYRECTTEGKGREEVKLIKKAEWIKISKVKDKRLLRLLQSSLDEGESEALALALEMEADLILLDDSDAREKARLCGLKMTGTIGILSKATMNGEIDSLKKSLERLRGTGFRISNPLEKRLLREVEED